MKNIKIAIIVPEYNEGQRAVDTISSILKFSKNLVIVVDDGSDDNSFELLEKEFNKNKQVVLLKHLINLGKGAAMRTGIKMARKRKMVAVIFIDADGQHNPKHLVDFERLLKSNDLVFGFRSMGVEMPSVRKWGNIFSLNLIKTLFKIDRSDLLCGYFAFKLKLYSKIKWSSSRYGVETEIAARAGKNKIDFREIKIDTIYIDKYKGVTIFDAFKILVKLPYWYFEKQ